MNKQDEFGKPHPIPEMPTTVCIGAAPHTHALTVMVDGVALDINDLLAYYNTAKANWDTCLKERDEALARAEAAAKDAARYRFLRDNPVVGWEVLEGGPAVSMLGVWYESLDAAIDRAALETGA
jgi:hypothetical protein